MIKPNSKLKSWVALVIILAFGLILARYIRDRYLDYYAHLEIIPTTVTLKKDPKPEPVVVEEPPVSTELPSSFLIKMSFTTQAPFALWDPLHQEACEEASLLMVHYYRTNQQFATSLEADTELKKIVTWETANGFEVDITAAEVVEVASGYLELTTGRVIKSPSIVDIKKEIAAGRPVILPAAGRQLHNPNFTPPGPIYHMLVLKGYDSTGFIANDPGTRNGESYHYSFETVMSAMHDWNPDDINLGQKAVVVFD